ncbi:toxin-antitoxin system, toxin component [Streptomyces bambusae]|uniref:toxin-antitoxin system, toxin component n=1 Tax=Streptomyces bambusae TaxID=1550616 RepID=UPI001CFED579|nr:toxin-antitoxin system, toxin component [Streptomyces bambusae]MCB5167671.1 toxin-antitoxin system, toxin component [Streptomyces bambusae]
MRRHRDELFAGAMALADGREPNELMHAVCAYLTQSAGRQVRLMLEPFPPDTVSGLWLDLGDHEVVAVEKNTLPLHQMVILGHELWHRQEHRLGRSTAGGPTDSGGTPAAARLLGERWTLGDAVAHVAAARTIYDVEEERRAERFGRLLAAKFRPFLLGKRHHTASDERIGRIWTSLGGR